VKSFGYIVLIALAGVSMLRAQTNTNTNTNAVSQILALVTTNAPANQSPSPGAPTRIDIKSDSVIFHWMTREAVYSGNVRADDSAMKLRCEWLIADLPQSGERISNIVAETNVVIDFTDNGGQTNHATCNQAVYAYDVQNGVTNETVTLTGNAKVENAKGWLTGEPIVWNRANGSLTASNEHMVFWQNLSSETGGTNSPVTETNAPIMTTNSPPAATNQMAAPK
jgi:lipopolysaccharide transport protein LptA